MDAETTLNRVVFRPPAAEDGAAVHHLVQQCKPLDENSLYCNLLQCSHFAETSVVAMLNAQITAFATGYLPPGRRDTLFIWQMAVAEAARGMGLAKHLLLSVLQRPVCRDVVYLEASILPENDASRGVFLGLANELKTECSESVMFDRDIHFKGQHETEVLLCVGPFSSPQKEGRRV
jgi:L-2,4-diaminobutyric acid acetyltransferase